VKIPRFVGRTFFGLVEILFNRWKLLVIICVAVVVLGVRLYSDLKRPPFQVSETFAVGQTTVDIVYPDKINTGSEASLKLEASISETVTISQSVEIAISSDDLLATLGHGNSQFTTILSTTHRTASWPDISLEYGQPRSVPSKLPVNIEATVNQIQGERDIEIRIDSFSEKFLSLGGAVVAAIIGLLGVGSQVWNLLKR
jgi:hypothetical protein